jgi:uncharacterized protein YyaL (SSP411 family)
MTQNRLATEQSPYLQQHADNPVDWFPWGKDAFARAAELDRPIFLSIGYATCHWCHVMEKESFEDPEVAEVLNRNFVSIKVDREERPDVDAVYMTVCQMLTGSGGWPLTLFLTPDRKPFFAATYLPKNSGRGRPGLIDIGTKVGRMWRSDRDRLVDSAGGISGHLGKAFRYLSSSLPGKEIFDTACGQLESTFDRVHGGFGGVPKFPTPHRLSFLLLQGHRTGNRRAIEMVEQTLAAMRLGGIWDHVGFGFHRYATDARWFLPHFEKMLYDQALLAQVYLEAGQLSGGRLFHETAREILTYVLRDMTDAGGGFYAAEDADSEGEEGRFYVWTADEFRSAAGDPDTARRWAQILGVKENGNFSEEATGRPTGTNVLFLPRPLPDWADFFGRAESELEAEWAALREKLMAVRAKRARPLRDEKILTDWNGLMISALAAGARILQVADYGSAARKAARFVLGNMRDADGRLLHRFREGEAGIPAMADDYAFFIGGLLGLYRVFFDPEDLAAAVTLQQQMIEDFWDETGGGFYLTAAAEADLPVRPKELYDGALPSANSVALENLVLMSRLTGDPRWEKRAEQLAVAVAGTVVRQPTAFTRLLGGLDALTRPGWEIVIAGDLDRSDTRALIAAVEARFMPASAVVVKSRDNAKPLERLAPYTRPMGPVDGRAAAYLCTDRTCDRPLTDPEKVRARLGGAGPSAGAARS